MLKKFRKDLRLDPKELDTFVGTENVSTKYHIEKTYKKNKLFRYLLYLRTKGVNLNRFFDSEIKDINAK